ncbi:MAG: Gfo/Idh/MocA family protein, partial [Bryobacteraceae bacterium]
MSRLRVAVVGAGQFGRNHIRVVRGSPRAELVAIVDSDADRAAQAGAEASCEALADARDLAGRADAAILAIPTSAHSGVGCALMEAGLDVLVEKPIAPDLDSADRLVETARATGRVLQAGHLERYNPVVQALERVVTRPLFFEIHRLSVFTPRSLD